MFRRRYPYEINYLLYKYIFILYIRSIDDFLSGYATIELKKEV